MDCSTPGFPVHHQLLEPTQTHVHRICDAIQPQSLEPGNSTIHFTTGELGPREGELLALNPSMSEAKREAPTPSVGLHLLHPPAIFAS